MNLAELERLKAQLVIIRVDVTEELEKSSDESDIAIFGDIITNLSEILDDLDCYIPEVSE